MTLPTYVLGHRNPDTDAISAAIGYATLLHLQGRDNVIAGRVGALRAETAYLLDRFGVAQPPFVRDVHPRVRDVMTSPAVTAYIDESLFEVGQRFETLNGHPLPVVDENGRLRGMIEGRDFAEAFFRGLDVIAGQHIPLHLKTIIRVIDGTVLVEAPGRQLDGRVMVAAMALESMYERIEQDTLVVIGDRTDAQLAAIDCGVGALIITGNQPVASEVIERAREKNVTIIVVPHHTYRTIQLIMMSIPIRYVMRPDPPSCSADDLLEDIRTSLTRVRLLPVLDSADHVVGVVTRTDLLRPNRRRVILVDHNERSQAVPGIEGAEIIGIIDHHRVADIRTSHPPLMRVEPVGSCSTLVAKLFAEAGITPPREIAGVLAGGILTDTLLFRSPTVTDEDRRWAHDLAAQAGVDPQELGLAILDVASDLTGQSADDLVGLDFKDFQVGDVRFGIAMLETVNAAALRDRRTELLNALEKRRANGYWSILLVVVDIFHERTMVHISGHAEEVARVFDQPLRDGSTLELQGVYSRKKQIVPLLGDIQTTGG